MDEWNKLNPEITNSSSTLSFKNILRKSLYVNNHSDISDIFRYCSPRKMNIILTQLRNNVSDLNFDKCNDFLTNDPSCSCGFHCEDKNHYFFQCQKYRESRHYIVEIYEHIGFVSANLLTAGNNNLSDLDNEFIFQNVVNFIVDTERFS